MSEIKEQPAQTAQIEKDTPEEFERRFKEYAEQLTTEFETDVGARDLMHEYAIFEDKRRMKTDEQGGGEYEIKNLLQEDIFLEWRREQEKSDKDELTGAYNLKYYRKQTKIIQRDYTAEQKRGEEVKPAHSLIIIDLDNFKDINDKCGHRAGDEVLKELVNRSQEQLRYDDTLVRYAGDEFVVIALIKNGNTLKLAERLRRCISDKKFAVHTKDGQKEIEVTISVGLCDWDESGQETATFRKADELLYKAKEAGRDCVYYIGEDGQPTRYVQEKQKKF